MSMEVPASHPRYLSLMTRHKMVEAMHSRVVAPEGLIAHGRGESLDYFLGEKTPRFALTAVDAAVCALLEAQKPVISVNGNVAALCPRELVELSLVTGAPLEINLFYRTPGREEAIEKVLKEAGALSVLGVGDDAQGVIPEIQHERRRVSKQGILIADVVLVPLEDGDRTEALVAMGKKVITVDLNPLSRTAQKSQITIVDNILRALPLMIQSAKHWKTKSPQERQDCLGTYQNTLILKESLLFMGHRLLEMAENQGGKP